MPVCGVAVTWVAMRFLIGFIVVLGGFFLLMLAYVWSRLRRLLALASPKTEQRPSINAPQAMVACAHCGLHIPEHEAHQHAGKAYCSVEHIHASTPHS